MILQVGGGMTIHCLVLGDFMTNCYVLPFAGGSPEHAAGTSPAEVRNCWVADPGLSAGPLLDYLSRSRLSPERILLTHGHADHIAGVAAVKGAYPAAVITAPAGDAGLLTDPMANMSLPFGLEITAPAAEETVTPGDELQMGTLTWRVLDAAGHSPGGVAYYCAAAEVVLAGDALFAAGIGRTDMPGASESRLLKNIRENLLSLPDTTRVLPGHGPPTTIGEERRSNPYLG